MAERKHLSNTREADVERSSDDIRRDVAKGEENISQTAEKIDERIQEKLEWRGYVKDSPYWALGAASGLGYPRSKDVHNTHHAHGADHGFHWRGSSRLARRPACRSRRPRRDQGRPAGSCHQGCRRLGKECNLDRGSKRWRRSSTQTGRGSTISPRVDRQKIAKI